MSAPPERSFAKSDIANSEHDMDEHHGGPPRGPRRKRFGNHQSKPKEESTNWMRKRVRTIERRFQKGEDLPTDVKDELERELARHKQAIAESTTRRKRGELIKRYHMVRFFERQKAERLVKQLKRKLQEAAEGKVEADADEILKLKLDLHKAEVDLAYTRYFPHLEPYISIYPAVKAANPDEKAKTPTAKAALAASRPPIWKEVEEALAQGEKALEKLRDRQAVDELRPAFEIPVLGPHSKPSKPKETAEEAGSTGKLGKPKWDKNSKRPFKGAPKESSAMEVDEESDGGGFFAD